MKKNESNSTMFHGLTKYLVSVMVRTAMQVLLILVLQNIDMAASLVQTTTVEEREEEARSPNH